MPLESSPSTVRHVWPMMPVLAKSDSSGANDRAWLPHGTAGQHGMRRALAVVVPIAGLALAIGYALLAG